MPRRTPLSRASALHALALALALALGAPACAHHPARSATAQPAATQPIEPLASRVARLTHVRPTAEEHLRAAHAILDHLGAVHADVSARLARGRRDARAAACLRDQFTLIDVVREFAAEHQSRLQLAVVRADETERYAEFDYLALLAERADAIRVAAAGCARPAALTATR